MDKDSREIAALISGIRLDQQHFGDRILNLMEAIMATLDDLVAKVKAESDVVYSAITLIQGLRDQVAAAGTDPAKLQEALDAIDASTGKLSAAVAASTPASTPAAEAASAPDASPAAPADTGTPSADGQPQ